MSMLQDYDAQSGNQQFVSEHPYEDGIAVGVVVFLALTFIKHAVRKHHLSALLVFFTSVSVGLLIMFNTQCGNGLWLYMFIGCYVVGIISAARCCV